MAALCAGLLALAALAIYLYDHSRRDVIAPGVTVAGVDVGGLRSQAARARLQSALRRTQVQWITIIHGDQRFQLTRDQAELRADIDRTVADAVRASRGGWIIGRVWRRVLGERLHKNIPLRLSYSHPAVQGLLAQVQGAVAHPARDASVSAAPGGHLIDVPGQDGLAVDGARLSRALTGAVSAPFSEHVIGVPVHTVKPAVTTEMLAAKYSTFIVVDRPDFTLFFYRHLHLRQTYPIAVGRQGLQTPGGMHHILDKQVNPAWHVPHSSWAGSLAGQVIPPGPGDPLVARWMAIDDQGDGIHGTDEPGSIGSAASHGCIRMLVPDVIELYKVTPLGTPVYVL